MSMSDPVADMLTRIRNAQGAGLPAVEMPASKMKAAIAKTLREEGYIADYSTGDSDGGHRRLKITLRYYEGKPVISSIRRVSRPGLRVYRGVDDLPVVLGGAGTVIIATSRGVMSGRQAKAARHGGEIICVVE
ncbi:MAG: 30S ribosomal protein S8 [Gammaproteobacteria bacterium]|nr:30S ribosomal protein S8 [Gammaproteobacteria bacterium]